MNRLLTACAATLAVTGPVVAEFSGVIARDASVEVCTPLGLQTVRLYATFTHPEDKIVSVGAHGESWSGEPSVSVAPEQVTNNRAVNPGAPGLALPLSCGGGFARADRSMDFPAMPTPPVGFEPTT